MFRPTASASRAVYRTLRAASQRSSVTSSLRTHTRSQLCTLTRRPTTMSGSKPLASRIIRAQYAEERGPIDNINKKAEEALGKTKILPDPDGVSTTSSIHPVQGEVHTEETGEKETDMLAGIRSDLGTIRETFSLAEVPRQAVYVGLAGVVPYAATSLGTVYCAWEINHASHTGMGFLMSEKTAELYLHVLEPLQVGYGATIISFLGAIHWGLEWAQFGGVQGYPRYAIGVVATGLAWPTLLLPVEYALISQFLIFNFLYYNDSRASKRGWAPPWYGVYRFVLTFLVGTSIVISLIGRGQIADQIGRAPGAAERIQKLRDHQAGEQAEEESARRKYLAQEDEAEDDEEEEEGEEEGGDEGEGGDDGEEAADGGDEKE